MDNSDVVNVLKITISTILRMIKQQITNLMTNSNSFMKIYIFKCKMQFILESIFWIWVIMIWFLIIIFPLTLFKSFSIFLIKLLQVQKSLDNHVNHKCHVCDFNNSFKMDNIDVENVSTGTVTWIFRVTNWLFIKLFTSFQHNTPFSDKPTCKLTSLYLLLSKHVTKFKAVPWVLSSKKYIMEAPSKAASRLCECFFKKSAFRALAFLPPKNSLVSLSTTSMTAGSQLLSFLERTSWKRIKQLWSLAFCGSSLKHLFRDCSIRSTLSRKKKFNFKKVWRFNGD